MNKFEQPMNKEEKMTNEDFEELTMKPENCEILDQDYPVSYGNEKKLKDTICTAAKDALANNAVRKVILELEPRAYGKEGEKVKIYYVTPKYAEKILPEEEVKRIKENIAKRTE